MGAHPRPCSPAPTAWAMRTLTAMRDAQREHERQGRVGDGDLMRGQSPRADPSHHDRRQAEHADFQQQLQRDRRAEAQLGAQPGLRRQRGQPPRGQRRPEPPGAQHPHQQHGAGAARGLSRLAQPAPDESERRQRRSASVDENPIQKGVERDAAEHGPASGGAGEERASQYCLRHCQASAGTMDQAISTRKGRAKPPALRVARPGGRTRAENHAGRSRTIARELVTLMNRPCRSTSPASREAGSRRGPVRQGSIRRRRGPNP